MAKTNLMAGAAQVDVSPRDSQFLYGYPHVPRMSTGIHDPLLASALYLSDGATAAIFVSSDIIYITKAMAADVRLRIAKATGVGEGHIMVSATHTHSGPLTADCIIIDADPVVPPPDPKYVALLLDGIVEAATRAVRAAQPAQAGLAYADDTGVGTNRHDPVHGPSDHQVPVLLVRAAGGKGEAKNIACMLVCSMHPTVMHEGSKLVSGDFPGLARIYLQQNVLGQDCVVLHQTGPAGNQSPRHVTKANTFAEAQRIGEILAKAVAKALPGIRFRDDLMIACRQGMVDLVKNTFPTVEQAQANIEVVAARLEHLRKTGAPKQEVRTAECDWFGAEETVTLAKAALSGRLEQAWRSCLPGEVQVVAVGPWFFVAWCGEIFVEYSLALKARHPNACLITCANGDLQTYIVTEEASTRNWYEKFNAIFGAASGRMMLDMTFQLLAEMQA